MTFEELKREIGNGGIVAVSTRLGQRVAREELIAAAMRTWEQAAIEEALGEDAAAVLPEAIRLVELRARVPRYQRDMLRYLARRAALILLRAPTYPPSVEVETPVRQLAWTPVLPGDTTPR